MANSIKYNIGTFTGLLGIANIYWAENTAGTKFLAYKVSVVINSATVEKWVFMPVSALKTYEAGNSATHSSILDLSTFAETAPVGLLDNDGYITFSNDAGLPRLYTSQGLFTLRGSDQVVYAGNIGTPTSGAKTDGSTVVINSSTKTISETISDGVTWLTTNWILAAGIVVAGLVLFGMVELPKFNAKKKTAKKGR